jgi:hypothetical protein
MGKEKFPRPIKGTRRHITLPWKTCEVMLMINSYKFGIGTNYVQIIHNYTQKQSIVGILKLVSRQDNAHANIYLRVLANIVRLKCKVLTFGHISLRKETIRRPI